MSWTQSELDIYNRALANVEATNKTLARAYILMQKEIADKLKQFYISIDPSWTQQYQAQRLTELFKQIDIKLSALTGLTTTEIERAYLRQFRSTFYCYAFDLSGYYATGNEYPVLPFSTLNNRAIIASLDEQIGANSFRDIVRNQQTALRESLREQVALSAGLGESIPQLTARLDAIFGSSISRVATTARTELLTALSLAQEQAVSEARAMGINFDYVWTGRADARERDSHRAMNNKKAREFYPNGDPMFKVGASIGIGPRLLTGPDQAAQNINCRCRRANIPGNFDDVDEYPTMAVSNSIDPVIDYEAAISGWMTQRGY